MKQSSLPIGLVFPVRKREYKVLFFVLCLFVFFCERNWGWKEVTESKLVRDKKS